MKTIILTLILFLITIINYGQNDKRIPELDRQNTRNDSLCFVVDDTSSLDSARFVTWLKINPLVDDLTLDNTEQDKDVAYMRTNLSGTEYKVPLRRINPDIDDLSTTSSLSSSHYLTVNVSGDDKAITYLNFINDLTAESSFQSAINTDIDNRVTESFILNLIQTCDDRTIIVGATQLATMYYCLTGNSVTGFIYVQNGGTGTATVDLDASLIPAYNIAFSYEGTNHNLIRFNADGTIDCDFDEGYNGGNGNFGFSYVVP